MRCGGVTRKTIFVFSEYRHIVLIIALALVRFFSGDSCVKSTESRLNVVLRGINSFSPVDLRLTPLSSVNIPFLTILVPRTGSFKKNRPSCVGCYDFSIIKKISLISIPVLGFFICMRRYVTSLGNMPLK